MDFSFLPAEELEMPSPTHPVRYDRDAIQLLEDIYGPFCTQMIVQNATPQISKFITSLNPLVLSSAIRPGKTEVVDRALFAEWNKLVLLASAEESLHENRHPTNGNLLPLQKTSGLSDTDDIYYYSLSAETCFPNPQWDFDYNIDAGLHSSHNPSPPVSPGTLPKAVSHCFDIDCGYTKTPVPSENIGSPIASNLPPLTTGLSAEAPPFLSQLGKPHNVLHDAGSLPASMGHIPPAQPPTGMYGRGVIIKNLPVGITLREICANIGGGSVERIDFQDGENRGVVGVYFVEKSAAEAYYQFVSKFGGIYWGSNRHSYVDVIPAGKGGLEPIKENVRNALINESATRCLEISNLSFRITRARLMADINSQSKSIRPAFEICEVVSTDTSKKRSAKQATIRMGSVGTALGARLVLSKNRRYKNTTIRFLPDPCNTELDHLGERWVSEGGAGCLERLSLSRVGRDSRHSGRRNRVQAEEVKEGSCDGGRVSI